MFNNGIVIIIALAVGIALILGFLIKGERFEMEQEASGKVISVKRGFSFTYLFFGPFVPLLRGHIAGFFLSLFFTFCSCGIALWYGRNLPAERRRRTKQNRCFARSAWTG